MSKEQLERLAMLAFDVLGDLMEPAAYRIREFNSRGDVAVFIERPELVCVPMAVVWEDWRRATVGTEFEGVMLLVVK